MTTPTAESCSSVWPESSDAGRAGARPAEQPSSQPASSIQVGAASAPKRALMVEQRNKWINSASLAQLAPAESSRFALAYSRASKASSMDTSWPPLVGCALPMH